MELIDNNKIILNTLSISLPYCNLAKLCMKYLINYVNRLNKHEASCVWHIAVILPVARFKHKSQNAYRLLPIAYCLQMPSSRVSEFPSFRASRVPLTFTGLSRRVICFIYVIYIRPFVILSVCLFV